MRCGACVRHCALFLSSGSVNQCDAMCDCSGRALIGGQCSLLIGCCFTGLIALSPSPPLGDPPPVAPPHPLPTQNCFISHPAVAFLTPQTLLLLHDLNNFNSVPELCIYLCQSVNSKQKTAFDHSMNKKGVNLFFIYFQP